MKLNPEPSNRANGTPDGVPAGANRRRARMLLFTILSILWVFPSFGAAWILWTGSAAWPPSLTALERLEVLSLEQWCGIVLLLTHGLFIILALHFGRYRPTEASV